MKKNKIIKGPDFEGAWVVQPSSWTPSNIRQAAFALSLAHVINEMKREELCPLAVYEIWAYWDQRKGSPRELKVAVIWGERPGKADEEWFGEEVPKPNKALWQEQLKTAKEFWHQSALKRDEGVLSWPFPVLKSLLKNTNYQWSLLYRDSRVSPPPHYAMDQGRLWRARRMTLKRARGDVGDLLRQLGGAIAFTALPMPSARMTVTAVKEARESGMSLAQETLMHCSMHDSVKNAEVEYDFACRELGQKAVESNAVIGMAWLQGFFMALSESDLWAQVAGSGEQEVFFCLLCRMEKMWKENELDTV